MKLFWEQGYEKTSFNNLVEYRGIHRKSLYDTFGEFVKTRLDFESSHAKTVKCLYRVFSIF